MVAELEDSGDFRETWVQNFRRLHDLLANVRSDSERLVVRQSAGCNGMKPGRDYSKFALPGATRHASLLSQIWDFKFDSNTSEHDFNIWETIKARYESQTGQAIPDSMLVATLLNKTTGPLQQRLRPNALALLFCSTTIPGTFVGNGSQGPAPWTLGR